MRQWRTLELCIHQAHWNRRSRRWSMCQGTRWGPGNGHSWVKMSSRARAKGEDQVCLPVAFFFDRSWLSALGWSPWSSDYINLDTVGGVLVDADGDASARRTCCNRPSSQQSWQASRGTSWRDIETDLAAVTSKPKAWPLIGLLNLGLIVIIGASSASGASPSARIIGGLGLKRTHLLTNMANCRAQTALSRNAISLVLYSTSFSLVNLVMPSSLVWSLTAIERAIAGNYHNKRGTPANILKLDTIQTHQFSIVSKQLEIANVIEMILSAE